MRVFISSTFQDLIEHREVLRTAFNRADTAFFAMENMGSRGEGPKTACKKEIDQCPIFIGIYAMRYGWVPENDSLSITEQEFDYAVEKSKIILCYVVDVDDWPIGKLERGPGEEKLKKFKAEKIDRFVRSEFGRDPDKLTSKVLADLTYHLTQNNINTNTDDVLADYPISKDISPPLTPFKNLEWFTRADARIFFGRHHEISQVFERVLNPFITILLLYGASGVGKSSLLHAGITARLPINMKSIYLRYGKNILDDAVNFLSEAKGYEQQLIILDQLEVVFYSDERSEFFENLSELIQNSSNCKYILSFREEVLAGVETQIGVYFNYYNKFRLEHLKINGVVEAIQGASLDPVCRSYYNLSEPVESEVEYIARDIIQEQQGNIIAPLLQFTLRKIWDGRKSDSEQIDGTPFCITQEAYQKNKYQGIKALVKECFEKIRENCLEDYESGLIFDILDFFISPELTSRSRTFKELIEVYGHIKARQFVTDGHDTKKSKYDAPHILTLCQYMKECFLLQQIDDNTFRLSHDSLAPTIAQFINQSQLEGQLVRRFLVSAVDKHYRLNIEQLLIILQASNSYRKLSQEELLAISRYKKIYSRSIIQSHLQHNDYGKAIDLMKSVFVDDRMSSNLRQLQIINYHLESVKKFSRMGLLSDPEENLLLTDLGKSLLGLTNRIPIFPVNADDDHFWTGLSILEQGNLFNAIELYAANLMYRVDQESRDDLIELVQRASTVQRKLVSRFSQVYKEKSGPQISKLLASLLDILYNLYQGQFKSDNFFDYISNCCESLVARTSSSNCSLLLCFRT
ncbi:MAG: DUF4062 domain-containing protein [Bacteroidota bacterium]